MLRFWGFLVLLLSFASPLRAEVAVPALTSAVTDGAGVLSADTKALIEQELRRLNDSGGSQIAVLTVPELGGESIEGFSIRVTDAWKLGSKEADKGVLLLLAVNDRKVRIEVGQGLEGVLPDAYAGRIVQQKMLPYLRNGDYNNAVLSGLSSILSYTDPDFKLDAQAAEARPSSSSRGSRGGFGPLFPLLIFGALFVLMSLFGGGGRGGPGSRYRRSGWASGALGGAAGWGVSRGGFGGGGFGGGGGGGFSGGGGGFSGGGASGSW